MLFRSTLSSQFHTLGTAVGYDMIEQKTKSDRSIMLCTKGGMVIGMAITLVLAIVLPSVWDGAISISTSLFFGLFCSSFLPMYAAGLYCKSIGKTAAISGMLTGFCTSIFWMVFIHTKEAAALKICMALTGKVVLFDTMIQYVDPLFIALPLSILVTTSVHLLSKKQQQQTTPSAKTAKASA